VSTALPDGQVWGSQAFHPSLWATATLTVSSDSLRPTKAICGACSQSLEWGNAAANSLAIIINVAVATTLVLPSLTGLQPTVTENIIILL